MQYCSWKSKVWAKWKYFTGCNFTLEVRHNIFMFLWNGPNFITWKKKSSFFLSGIFNAFFKSDIDLWISVRSNIILVGMQWESTWLISCTHHCNLFKGLTILGVISLSNYWSIYHSNWYSRGWRWHHWNQGCFEFLVLLFIYSFHNCILNETNSYLPIWR